MNLAKVSANGQVTVPVEVRRHLHLSPGDKLLFVEKDNGEVVLVKAAETALNALKKAQDAFSGASSDFNVRNEDEVNELVNELRSERAGS
jgi:AbrB family looped-hinge helix DNA binding protein